jgi:hypothetical protein
MIQEGLRVAVPLKTRHSVLSLLKANAGPSHVSVTISANSVEPGERLLRWITCSVFVAFFLFGLGTEVG